jgi:succinate dehydrogenase hydrophobic anchor subunit
MSDTRPELTVSLWRGARQGRYQTYNVPLRENQTVLDVVTFVQRHLDPTLSYRFACRVGVCGSCAMTVNGRPRWTCRTHVSRVAKGGRLEIGPLENLPVIKDLATDMREFFEKWQRATAALMVPLVLLHVAVIFYATRRGMTAADILARTRGSIVWASLYGAFVVAVAIHAAIGVRNVLAEWSPLNDRIAGLLAVPFGILLLLLGLRAVAAVVLS